MIGDVDGLIEALNKDSIRVDKEWLNHEQITEDEKIEIAERQGRRYISILKRYGYHIKNNQIVLIPRH